MTSLGGGSQDAVDGADELIPPAGLFGQLPAPGGSQPVIAGLAIVFRRAPERRDPGAILQAMQSRVERAVLDLQNLIRAMLDHVSDGVSVRRAKSQRLQEQQVERTLDQVALQRSSASFGHKCDCTPEDHLLEKNTVKVVLR